MQRISTADIAISQDIPLNTVSCMAGYVVDIEEGALQTCQSKDCLVQSSGNVVMESNPLFSFLPHSEEP